VQIELGASRTRIVKQTVEQSLAFDSIRSSRRNGSVCGVPSYDSRYSAEGLSHHNKVNSRQSMALVHSAGVCGVGPDGARARFRHAPSVVRGSQAAGAIHSRRHAYQRRLQPRLFRLRTGRKPRFRLHSRSYLDVQCLSTGSR
jgi:hypothetical protein